MNRDQKKMLRIKQGGALLAAILVIGAIYGVYRYYALYKNFQEELADSRAELEKRTAEFQSELQELQLQLAVVESENRDITAILSDEQKKNLELERQRKKNEEEIETLTKLTTLDPELLKKYSKVYFLSENYAPPRLSDIDPKYWADPLRPMQILGDVEPFLLDMLEDAQDDGVSLLITSAYRSFGTQTSLKSSYVVQYGAGTANSFSAEQGYSEHQMGTTADFTTPELKTVSLAFDNAPAFEWLQDNAHRYGFVLSYPPGNEFYVYEPWHWRFVGRELARYLHSGDRHFYETDQRELDEYLVNIFD